MTFSIATALSVGFALAEREMQFSLKSFGPLAAFLVIFTVSLVVLGLFRTLGLQTSTALALAYLTVYLSLGMVTPTIFEWISSETPWINNLLYLGFFLAVGRIIYALFHRHTSVNPLSSKIDRAINGAAIEQEMRDEKEETTDIKDTKSERKLTKKGKRDSRDIGSNLRSILKAIDKSGNSREGRSKIARTLQKISESEHLLFKRLRDIEELNTKLGRHDSQRHQALRDRYATASGREKEGLRLELIYEQQKLKAEQGIAVLKDRIVQQTNAMNENIRLAAGIMREGSDMRHAKAYVERAIECEEEISKELGNIIRLEKAVTELSKREKKTIRKNG